MSGEFAHKEKWFRFRLERRGANAVGYGLVLGLIGIAALTAVTTTGDEVEKVFCVAADRLSLVVDGEPEHGCESTGGSGGPTAHTGSFAVTLVEDGGAWRWDNEGSPEYAASCNDYLNAPTDYQPGDFSDEYWLTINGGTPAPHACDQVNDGGGWTMAARLGMDGALHHDAPNWTDGTELNATDASASSASSAVFPAYGLLSASAMRGCVGADCMTQSLASETALDAFSGGHRAAEFDRSSVEGIAGASALEQLPGCDATAAANGINASNGGDAQARFGGLADDTPPCNSPDTAIGLGLVARDGAQCSAGAIVGSGLPQRSTVAGYTFIDDNIITQAEGGLFASYQRPHLAVDWDRGYSYFVDSDSNALESGLRKMRIDTMVEVDQALTDDIRPSHNTGFLDTIAVNKLTGNVFISAETGNSHPIISVNPDTMTQTGIFGYRSNGLSNSFQRFVTPTYFSTLGNYLIVGSIFDDVGAVYGDGVSYAWGHGQTISRADVKGVTNDGNSTVYVLGGNRTSSSSTINIYRYSVPLNAHLTPDYPAGTNSWGLNSWTINASDIVSGATLFENGDIESFIYDHSDGDLIFSARLNVNGSSNQRYLVKWSTTGGVQWATRTDAFVNYTESWDSSYVDGDVGIITGRYLYYVDTSNGAVTEVYINPINEFGAQVWDSRSKSTITYSTSHGWVRIFFDAGQIPDDPVLTADCRAGALWVR